MMPLIHQSYSPVAMPPTSNDRALEKVIVPYLAQDVSFTLNPNQPDGRPVVVACLAMAASHRTD